MKFAVFHCGKLLISVLKKQTKKTTYSGFDTNVRGWLPAGMQISNCPHLAVQSNVRNTDLSLLEE